MILAEMKTGDEIIISPEDSLDFLDGIFPKKESEAAPKMPNYVHKVVAPKKD